MSQPITHYMVCEEAIGEVVPDVWHRHKNFAGLGSFGPDLFYIKDLAKAKFRHEYSYELVSDEMHWDGTFDCYCAMLDYIKESGATGDVLSKMKAFAYGFYSHVITDCVFHPFVYRQTNDHWRDHPEPNYKDHKTLEAMLDNYILMQKQGSSAYQFNPKVGCAAKGNEEKLDADVFKIFRHGLEKAYRSRIDFYKYFDRFSSRDEDHPIHAAYEDFDHIIKTDFYMIGKIHYNPMALEPIKPIADWAEVELARMNENGKPWYEAAGNETLIYTALGLYNYAVEAVKQIVLASEDYLADSGTSSMEFFKKSDALYLNENFNLDTGLPCSFNEDATNKSSEGVVRFAFKTDLLNSYYSSIAGCISNKEA